MRVALFAVLLAAQLLQSGEPPEYAPGKFCSPAGDVVNGQQTADHPCACKRMSRSESCDDPEMDSHQSDCKQFCHEQHCSCPIACEKDQK